MIVPKVKAKSPPRGPSSKIPSTSKEIVYEISKQAFSLGDDDDDVTKVVGALTEDEGGNVGTVAIIARSRHFLDTQYGIRKDGEQLMIGVSPVFTDPDDNITTKGIAVRGTERLLELVTRKNVNTQLIGKEDPKIYIKSLISAWR